MNAGPSPTPVAGLRDAWRDYVSMTSGHIAGLVLGTTTVVLATRLLGPRGYGQVAIVFSVAQLLYWVLVHWVMAAVIRFGREALTHARGIAAALGSWLILVAASTSVALVLILLARDPLRRWVAMEGGARSLLALTVVAMVLAKTQEHLLVMASLMRDYVVARLIGKVAAVLGLAALVWWSPAPDAAMVVFVTAAGLLTQAFAALPAIHRQAWPRPALDRHVVTAMTLYAAPLALRCTLAYLLEWVDVYWLRVFRTAAEIGVYYSSYQVALVCAEALGVVTTIAFPLLTALRARGSHFDAYARIVPQLAIAWTLVVGLVGIAGPPMVSIALGETFGPVATLMPLLLVATSFQSAMYLSAPVFTSHDMTGRATALFIPMVLTNVAADFVMVPRWGAVGAALATILTYAVAAVVHGRLLRTVLAVPVKALVVPTVALVPAALCAASRQPAAAAAAYLIGATALVWWARRRFFAREDARLLEAITMPERLRATLTRLYAVLG